MSFWELSTGETATNAGTEYEIEGGGNFDPLPDGCHVLATIDAAEWRKTQDGMARYVSLKWNVVKPEEYGNRKIFHKLWVDDLDPSAQTREKAIAKRDKARRMLAAIDANAGGKLSKLNEAPTDEQLAAALNGKIMVIGLRIWESTNQQGEAVTGNWVYFVGDKKSDLKEGKPYQPKEGAAPRANGGGGIGFGNSGSSYAGDLDDSIPF